MGPQFQVVSCMCQSVGFKGFLVALYNISELVLKAFQRISTSFRRSRLDLEELQKFSVSFTSF